MLNEIKLKLQGMYWANENQIETVHEGIQRNLCNGNEDEIQKRKSEKANMCMSVFFKDHESQKADFDDMIDEAKEAIRAEAKIQMKQKTIKPALEGNMDQQVDQIYERRRG